MKKLTIGIALCTYNGALFIQEQLNSLIDQTVLFDQLVIVDDQSNDDSMSIMIAWFNQQSLNIQRRVKIIQNEYRLGVTQNFEKAFHLLTTDIIFPCDQDDIWYKEKIALFKNEFNKEKQALLIHSNALLLRDNKKTDQTLFKSLSVTQSEIFHVNNGGGFFVYARRNLVTGCACAFRKELLSLASPFPILWLHDEWLGIMATIFGDVKILTVPTILYRQHANNVIGAHSSGYFYLWDKFKQTKKQSREIFYKNRIKKILQVNDKLPINDEKKEFLRGYIEHLMLRSDMSSSILKRVTTIYAEWRSGRYQRYSRQWFSIARDVFFL